MMRFGLFLITGILLGGQAWAGAADNKTIMLSLPSYLPSPGPLLATTNSSQVTLRWTNISSEHGYIIYRRLKGTTNFSVIGETSADRVSYSDPSGASRIYEYRVRAWRYYYGTQKSFSQYTNLAYSAPTTSGSGSVTTPLSIIAGPTVSNVTSSSATLQWSLNSNATGQIQYGLTAAYGGASIPELSYNYSTHIQTISGLVAGATYHYRVISKTASGAQVLSPDQIFTTLPNQAISVSPDLTSTITPTITPVSCQ